MEKLHSESVQHYLGVLINLGALCNLHGWQRNMEQFKTETHEM